VLELYNTQFNHLDEERDVHPILRANPFLIEDGLRLVRGEKYPSRDELKHIDLQFEDSSKTPTFVEVKWNDISEKQMVEYRRLIDKSYPKNRILWAVPLDLVQKASIVSKYGIELKSFDRHKIIQIKNLQTKTNDYLQQIKSILSEPFKVNMHGESITFNNPMEACYFEGKAETDRMQKKLGLKEQNIGRQLDLIKSLTGGHLTEFHKEKILFLIWETLRSPYSYKTGKFWRIMNGGLIELMKERQQRNIEKLVIKIYEIADRFYNDLSNTIKEVYDLNPKRYDLSSMTLFELSKSKGKTTFSIDELIKCFIDEFEIRPSNPPKKIKHGILNQWVENIVSIENYENDMAKRLLELAVLKRILIPRMGTVDMWILAPSKKDNRYIAERQTCQMLFFNNDVSLYLDIGRDY